MQNRQIVIWAVLTLALAGVLFFGGFQIAGRLQKQNYSVPYPAMVFPAAVLIQAVWLAGGIYLARSRKRPAVLTGMACGIVCEAVVLFGFVLYAASSRY